MITTLFNVFNIIGSEWVMWILMGLSVISLAVVFERYRNLRNQERVGAYLWKEQIEGWMKTGKLGTKAQMTELHKKYPCLESGLVEVLSVADHKAKDDLELLMNSYLGRKKVELDKNLNFLGTLGSNAPFIGLFGTVLGIIRAFATIGSNAAQQSGGAQSVSLGLSEALVATAVGLLVAIPAVIFFNYFQKKIKVIISRAESLGQFVISYMGNE